jgi:uncharacterized protein (DUF885 family)
MVNWRRLGCLGICCSWLSAGCALGYFCHEPVALRTGDSPVAIANDFWEIYLAQSPLQATRLGDRRFDAVLPDLSPTARLDLHRKREELLGRVRGINPGYLAPDAFRTARFLASVLHAEVGAEICQWPLWSLSPFDGLHVQILELGTTQVVDSPTTATAYLSRLGGLATLFEQQQANLREGLRMGLVAPRSLVGRVLSQLQALSAPVVASQMLRPVEQASGLSAADTQALHQDVCALVHDVLQPALQAYAAFVEQEILPAAREPLSITAFPEGAACYAHLWDVYGATPQTPVQVHQGARDELERLQEAMLELAQAQGFTSVEPYQAFLRRPPPGYPARADLGAQLAAQQRLLQGAYAALPKAFLELGSIEPLDILALPAAAWRHIDDGIYLPRTMDGARRARYMVPHDLLDSGAAAEASLFCHAVPGHHLQHSLDAQAADLPLARRYIDLPGFSEGWALYGMRLADALQLYSGPAGRFGMLAAAARQAALVQLDTGLHALGWTRQQARDFLQSNLGLSAGQSSDAIDRCVAHPGAALAGPLAYGVLMELRQQAQRRLGKAFDLKLFHQKLLQEGPLPLPVLRDVVGSWLSHG